MDGTPKLYSLGGIGVNNLYPLTSSTKYVDSTQELPKKLELNTIVKVLNPGIARNVLNIVNNNNHINRLYRRAANGIDWETISVDGRKLYDGDVIICYDVSNSYWYLLENVDTGNATSTYYRTTSEALGFTNNFFTIIENGASEFFLSRIPLDSSSLIVTLNGLTITVGNSDYTYNSNNNSITLSNEYILQSMVGGTLNIQYAHNVLYEDGSVLPSDRIKYDIPLATTLSGLDEDAFVYKIYKTIARMSRVNFNECP
jgi:hypothetical protein